MSTDDHATITHPSGGTWYRDQIDPDTQAAYKRAVELSTSPDHRYAQWHTSKVHLLGKACVPEVPHLIDFWMWLPIQLMTREQAQRSGHAFCKRCFGRGTL